MQGVVRHGRTNYLTVPPLLGAHAACRRLMAPKFSMFWPLPRGSEGDIPRAGLRYVFISGNDRRKEE